MWDSMFAVRRADTKPVSLLYIGGRGFDSRARMVMEQFVGSLVRSRAEVKRAELVLVGFSSYQLSEELQAQTEENASALQEVFSTIGTTETTRTVTIGEGIDGEDDISASSALRRGTEQIVQMVDGQTDIVLDVSSLPRIVYLSIMLGLLQRLIAGSDSPASLAASGVTFQVLVGEDAALDGQIRSEDPANELVLIPGYASALQTESTQDWPLVWFPILGENRTAQMQKVMSAAIPNSAEICPVLPHPSREPRRGDRLLIEYKEPLFDARETPLTNVLYAHEANPFEAYRQLLGAMKRYQQSFSVLGGCRLVVTPLASKLITVGAALACFEMKLNSAKERYGVAIPYAEPKRYVVSAATVRASRPDVSSIVLTGDAYV
ncbi:hypothetical protein WS95_13390 [Burkholderia sp. MSMB1826]|nr:hypothetical protein WS95_13390 [Burkholderia sp. MSMB1826]